MLKFGDGANRDLLDLLNKNLEELLLERLRNVETRERRALLACKARGRERSVLSLSPQARNAPWYSNAPRRAPMAAARTSAEGWTSWKFLPPVSPTMRG